MWKPGQLITLNGKVYRIRYIPKEADYGVCSKCDLNGPHVCDKIEWRYMMHSYFEQVYPKT